MAPQLDLERFDARLARTEERVDGARALIRQHEDRLNAMTSVATSVIQLVERFGNLQADVAEMKEDYRKDREKREKREAAENAAREKRALAEKRDRLTIRIALWTLTIMVLCAVIAASAAILH